MRIERICAVMMALAVIWFGGLARAEVPEGYPPALVKAAQAEGKLVIYSAMRRSVGIQLVKEYEKEFGIKVDFTRKSTGAITQMVEAQRLAGATRFDITGSADESVIRRWMHQGVLAPYNPVNARFFPKKLAKPVGYLNYVWLGPYVMAYNKNRVAPEDVPKTWKDVLAPKWKGRLAMANPEVAAGARLLLEAAYEHYGWDYFRALSKNEPLLVNSIIALPRLLSSGEADLAFPVAQADILLRISKGEPFTVVYPADFIPASHFSIGMSKNAPHPNAAKLWMEFELSPEAQKIYAASGRIPLRRGISMPFKHPPLKDLKIEMVNPDLLAKRRKELVNEFIKIMKKGR